MLRAILVDDEIAALRSLELLLRNHCDDIQVVGTARSAKEGLDLVLQQNPDIVFLDIEMPLGSGFELIEHSPDLDFQVIFITAYNHYAVKAFRYSAIDFILKPIDLDELIAAIDKVKELKNSRVNPRERYSILFENIKEVLPRKLVLPKNGNFFVVDLRDVLLVNMDSNKEFTFTMIDGTSSSCLCRGIDVEELLTARGFLPISSSCLVNLNKVQRFDKSGKGTVIMENGSSLTLDTIRKEDFIDKLLLFNQEHKS